MSEAPAPAGKGRILSLGRRPISIAHVGAIAITLVALAPVITVVLQRAGRAYLPLHDQSVIDLRVRDVLTFSQNTPLVGVYSRYGFSHPGPTLYYLVAPFTWLFGNAAWATLVAFALLQGVAIAWTGRLAWKTGGLQWTITWMAIVALSYVATTPLALQLPWNPTVVFPFFILFLLQCWVVARGDPRRLLGLAFVGSFLVQTHISYAFLVALLGGWAVIRMVGELRHQDRRIGRSNLVWPAVVLGVMWFAPVVLDPIFDSPSNIHQLASFFFGSQNRAPNLGFSAGLGYLATEFRWLPPWLGGSEATNPFTEYPYPSPVGWLVVPVVLVGLAWWSWWRARRADLRLVAELVTVLLVASGMSLVLTQGEPRPYLFLWRIVAGTVIGVLTITVAVSAFANGRLKVAAGAWTATLALTVAVASGSYAEQVAAANGPVWPTEPVEASIIAQMNSEGQPDGRALVRTWGDTEGGIATGLIDELAREHKPIFVDPSLGYEFGDGRTATPQDVRWILVVTEDSALYSLELTYPGHRVLAVSHPLPAGQQAELIQLQQHIDRVLAKDRQPGLASSLSHAIVGLQLANLPGISRQEIRRLAQLDTAVAAHGCLCAVVEYPPSDWHVGPQPTPA